MAAAGPSKAFVQLTSPEEGNWLSLGRALTSVLCQGLRPYIQREMDLFYSNVIVAMTALRAGPCTCVYDPSRKKNHYHDMSTCAWAKTLQGVHIANKPNWKQSDSSKWIDPSKGKWEIAKLFLPDIGLHMINSAEDLDITGILNLLYWCNHFLVQRPLIEGVRETRNTKWVHVPKLELNDKEKRAAFQTIEKLLQDPVFWGDVDVQNALQDILALKCTSDVQIFKAEVLSHFKEAIRSDMSSLKSEMKSLRKESKKNEKQRARVEGQLRNLKTSLKKVEQKTETTPFSSLVQQILKLPMTITIFVVKTLGGIQQKSFNDCLYLLILFCCIGILDESSHKDGCPTEAIGVPFDTKEFNFTYYLNDARDNFFGRQWLFQLMENSFYPSRQGGSGVLIIGDPGTGKSALTAQLICSRKSSPTFYDHVLGYHCCRRPERNTQNGGKFVRNLADMIARRLPEYGYMVADNSQVQRSLNNDCVTNQGFVWCFQEAILTPLALLKNKPKENWYVVIDALDECVTQSETARSIVCLLDKRLQFPLWLKLVMTSRNETSFSINSNNFIKLKINPEDTRNIQDIKTFLAAKLFQDGPLIPIRPIKFWFGDNSRKNTARLTSALLSKSQGNFLLAKEMLHFWEISRAEIIDPYSLPETLGELYKRQFERLYSPAEKFEPLRRVLELLVASFQPVTIKQIFDILRRKENLNEASRLKYRMDKLGHFLRYEENDRVTIYHPSLTEWLTSESNTNGPFYVRKKNGHEMFCDYYFSLITEGHNPSLPENIFNFAQHIAHGSWKKDFVKKFLSVPSKVFDSSDPTLNRTLLHLAATINSTDALDLLLRHVTYDDYIDNRGKTPAFLAAAHGLVNNVALMVKNGANIHHKTKSLLSTYKLQGEESVESDNMNIRCNPVFQSKSKLFSSTMLHAAAHGGHLEVVNFLIDNGANISTVNGVQLNALQIASEKGHVEVVQTLYEAGAVPDQTALHHAAANNKLEVVKYLLQIGVKDKCMRCDGSFYWLKGKHRLQRDNFSMPSFAQNNECIHSNSKIKHFKIHFEHGRTKDKEGDLYDDKHLIFCETALHAAVSVGHEAVVRELASHPATALTCRDYSGRTPLHEAVRKRNSRIVSLLLWKDPKLVYETCNHLQIFHENTIPLSWMSHDGLSTECDTKIRSLQLSFEEVIEYDKDICHCGYTSLHLAARYGLTDIGLDLISAGAKVDASDCLGATPLHVAACHNHIVFVHVIAHANFGVDINSKSSNGSTPLHSAAACGAVEVIDHLIYHGAKVNAVDEGNLSPLHYSILHVRPLSKEKQMYRTNSCGVALHVTKIDRRGLGHFFIDGNLISTEKEYRWLVAFLHLIERGSKINSVDLYGRTPLHLASGSGLADAVILLMSYGAKLEIRDKFGKTPLQVAVENCTVESTTTPFVIGRRFLDLPTYLRDNEMVVYLLLSNGASFKKCERNSTSLLHHALAKNQPYIAQMLLFKGASVHCKDSFGRTPALDLIANGGGWTDILLKHLHYSTGIKCGESFISSVFHLFCFFSPKRQDNNFFQQIRCKKQVCLSRKSFLERAMKRHRLKSKIIDSCLDAEGFRPIHRAAQGANLIGVRSLLELGANPSLLSPQGHDALTLAILHSGGSIWPSPGNERPSRNDNASLVALELLHHAIKTRGFQIVCDSSKSEMTLYHLAASRGLVKFIQEILKEKKRHQLDVNCPNKDGITPLYLAEVFSFETNDSSYNPWRDVATIIKEHGGKMMFPAKDVEYRIIYERLRGWIPSSLELNLRPDVYRFVLALWAKFQDRQKSKRQCNCNWDWIKENNFSVLLSSYNAVFNEITRQWRLIRRKLVIIKPSQPEAEVYSSFTEDIRKCLFQNKHRYSTSYLKRILAIAYTTKKAIVAAKRKVRYKKILKISQMVLFYLMRWWHLRMFQEFGCPKSVVDKYRPFLLDEKRLTQLITTFKRSTLDWSLEVTCSLINVVFHTYLSSDLCSNGIIDINSVIRIKYPDFIRNQMGWTVDQTGSWPLDFLFKFSLGLYHQYEYLKMLSVGLERGTRLALHSENFEQDWRRIFEKDSGRLCP